MGDITEKLACSRNDRSWNIIRYWKNYELPDGQVNRIGNESFGCEVLFKPTLLAKKCQRIHKLTYDSLWNVIIILGQIYQEIR